MHLQPNRDYKSDDVVQTPLDMARRLVAHFRPSGTVLEPCRGKGNILKALQEHMRRGEESLPEGKTKPAKSAKRSVAKHGSAEGSRIVWCEIQKGRDFFAWDQPVDWILTNPPWSLIRPFLAHAMGLADNVVFLLTINHVWTKARIRDIQSAGFGIKEIALVEMPPSFPQSGFQLGAVHLARDWQGPITLSDISAPAARQTKRISKHK